MLKKLFGLSSGVVISLISLSSFSLEPVQAQEATYHICNKTDVRNSFALIDTDRSDRKNYTLRPGECWEYWGFEYIEFNDQYERPRRYNLYTGRVYTFERRPNGAIDLFEN